MRTSNEKINLVEKTKHLWHCTYCEPTQGWPGKWSVVWRSEEYHGKIGTSLDSKDRPTDTQLKKLLITTLKERFSSKLRCDATRVAKLYLSKPFLAEIDGCIEDIRKLVVRHNDILVQGFDGHGLGIPEVNQLFQRIKDIHCAQESMTELDNYIDRNLKKHE